MKYYLLTSEAIIPIDWGADPNIVTSARLAAARGYMLIHEDGSPVDDGTVGAMVTS